MTTTLAFDVYGTLIDTSGVYEALEDLVGAKARVFTETWRSKQLEYSFRRGLMNAHVDFAVVTRQALEFCCKKLRVDLSINDKAALMDSYRELPAFSDTEEALELLNANNYRLFAFSNGSQTAVRGLLERAKINHYFQEIVSCADIRMFKPNPLVYQHFNQKTGTIKERSFLISGNAFDVLGAINYGMKGVWVKRSPEAIWDPWEMEPTLIVESLNELPEALSSFVI